MHSLRVWRGKWEQRTVSVLELVATIGIFPWATGKSLHSMEKNRNWFERQSSIILILLEFPLPSGMALILLSSMTAGSFSTQVYERRCNHVCSGRVRHFVSPRLAHCVTDWISFGGVVPYLLKLRLQE